MFNNDEYSIQKKIELRQYFLKKRLNLSLKEFTEKSFQIQKKLLKWIQKKQIKKISSYFSFRKEVDLSFLHKELLKKNYQLAFPHIENSNNYKMDFFIVKDLQKDFETHKSSFIQVKKNKYEISIHQIDCILLPGLVFNKRGYRIGYGKAYYDRCFTQLKTKPFKVALAFDFQINDFIEEAHDQKIDFLFTENNMLKF